MPVTVGHQLTATTPDDPAYEIRPSHWNSNHAVTLSVAATEISGLFANSNGVSFGTTNGSITASHNGLTTAAASNHSHGNPTLNLTNLSGTTASNSAGLTLSLSAAAAAANAVNLLGANTAGNTTATGSTLGWSGVNLTFSGTNGSQVVVSGPGTSSLSGTGALSISANGSTVSLGVPNLSIYGVGNTTGQSSSSSVSLGSLSIHGTGGVSVGMSNGSLYISGNTGGGGGVTTGGFYALGNTTQNSSTTLPLSAMSLNALGAMTAGYSNGSIQLSAPATSSLVAGANITVSTNGSTISIIGATVAASPLSISAGTTSSGLQSVVFSDSNGISFGLNGSTITGSHNGLTSQSNQAVSANNGSYAFQTLSFSNANGISFGTSAGSAITASHNALTTARASNDAIGLNTAGSNVTWTANSAGLSLDARGYAGTATAVTGAASITLNSAGLSFNGSNLAGVGTSATNASITLNSNGLAISVAAPGGGVNPVVSAANGSYSFTTLSLSNANGISFGTSAGSAITASHNAITTGRASNDGIGLNTAGTNVTWTVNSSGLSLNASGYAGTGTSVSGAASLTLNSNGLQFNGNGFAGTATGFTGANISGSMTHNTAGLSLSLSVAAPGAAAENNAINLLGANTAGNTTATGSTIGWSGINLTLSGTNASQVVISAPATSSLVAAADISISTNGSTISISRNIAQASFWNPFEDPQTTASQIGQGSLFVQPMFALKGGVSLSRFDVLGSFSISSSSNSSHAGALSFSIGVYTRNGNTLSLASSGSQSYQWTNTSNNSLGSISALRRFSIPMNVNLTNDGDYWIGLMSRSTTSNAAWYSCSNARVSQMSANIQGLIGEASNNTRQLNLGFGLWSTTSTALPASLAFTDVRGQGSGVANNALPFFVNACNLTV